MITNLHIKNIGIIDDIEIDLGKALNVLTGETGAGKSLIIGSLNIISGGRFSKEMIRKGETNSFVEVALYEPENENAIDGTIIISREINVNGKNMCKINGRMVTVNELKEFMRKIIEIHGQNDSQNLLDNKEHLKYLDNFIGKDIKSLKEKYKEQYVRYLEIKKELKENYGDEKERQRKLDLLKYQFQEIEEAGLIDGEEEELSNKQKLIVNAEKIAKTLQEVDLAIGENAIDIISNSIRNLEKIESFDSKYQETANNLKSAYYELQEVSRDITNYKDEVDFDEFDMVVLPGGMPGTLNLKNHDGVRYVVKQYAKEGRYVGAICAAPTILKSLGVLEGRRATCYPGVEDEMEDVVLTETAVVVDENIITSQGVGTAIDFGLKLIEILDGEEKAKEIADSIVF